VDILKKQIAAARKLGELSGVAFGIPNPRILVSSLGIQEAKESSAIENIVTTDDELFLSAIDLKSAGSHSAKEVLRYAQALWLGFSMVEQLGLLRNQEIIRIQEDLVGNDAGFRRQGGTVLKDERGRTVYTPPQDPQEILQCMSDLERFINDPLIFRADPLVKMALIHHQFESIHPFYDGNGRTGRIVNVLYLVREGLLSYPILYLSRYIVETKSEY